MAKSKGRLTFPTDSSFVEESKRIAKKWGADAVRDCDGTTLPEHPEEIAPEVYKTYFVSRGDYDYAREHPEYLQCAALMSKRRIASGGPLDIDLLEGFMPGQFAVNEEEGRDEWQVIDRTSGQEIKEYTYRNGVVRISHAEKGHEYTVDFFARNTWDPTHLYNYVTNGWTGEKDKDIDPIYPEAFAHMKERLRAWLKENPSVTVVRFTTFFYHFVNLWVDGKVSSYVDWHGYGFTVSPAMFRRFKKEYGYAIHLEDFIRDGTYSNHFVLPSKAISDYMDLVDRLVCGWAKELVDLVHSYGKKAFMFNGDHRIGADPHGKYFASIGLDGVIGAPSAATDTRCLGDIPSNIVAEGRFYPYFFPDTMPNEETACRTLLSTWHHIRRGMLRKPLDRMGFGGYLSLAAKFPRFCEEVEKEADEFRFIYDTIHGEKPYAPLRVGVLTHWGKERAWEINSTQILAFAEKNVHYGGVLEALAGLPIETSFLDFDEVKKGALSQIDVLLNIGDSDAFTGREHWLDPEVVEKVRSFVLDGGGFLGVGLPTSVPGGFHFFRLYDVLGVDQEQGYGLGYIHFSPLGKDDFVLADVTSPIDFGRSPDFVYPLEGTTVLAKEYAKGYSGDGCGSVKLSLHSYGKGCGAYLAGLPYSIENARLLYRLLLRLAHKEDWLLRSFSSSPKVECNYYPGGKKYFLSNLTDETLETTFYDQEGKSRSLTLSPYELRLVEE